MTGVQASNDGDEVGALQTRAAFGGEFVLHTSQSQDASFQNALPEFTPDSRTVRPLLDRNASLFLNKAGNCLDSREAQVTSYRPTVPRRRRGDDDAMVCHGSTAGWAYRCGEAHFDLINTFGISAPMLIRLK